MAHKMALGFVLAALIVCSLAISCYSSTKAQSNPLPSVPEFTVKFVDFSYNIPTTSTSSTDAYTGKQVVTTQAGYYIQNASFVINIKNQPFTGYEVNGNYTALYYGIQVKGHFTPDWGSVMFYYTQPYIQSSTEEYTTLTMGLTGNNDTTAGADGQSGFVGASLLNGAYGGQLDFRVLSLVGYYVTVQDPVNAFNVRHPYHQEFVSSQTSDYSSIQTIDISANPVTATPQPHSSSSTLTQASGASSESNTNSPAAPTNGVEFVGFIGLGIVVALLVVVVVLLSRKIRVLERRLAV
jgi:hypothetical protein